MVAGTFTFSMLRLIYGEKEKRDLIVTLSIF